MRRFPLQVKCASRTSAVVSQSYLHRDCSLIAMSDEGDASQLEAMPEMPYFPQGQLYSILYGKECVSDVSFYIVLVNYKQQEQEQEQ